MVVVDAGNCDCCQPGSSTPAVPIDCCNLSTLSISSRLLLTVTSITGDVPSFFGLGDVFVLNYSCQVTAGSQTTYVWLTDAVCLDPFSTASVLVYKVTCNKGLTPNRLSWGVQHVSALASCAAAVTGSPTVCGGGGVTSTDACAFPDPFVDNSTISYTFPPRSDCCENTGLSGAGAVGYNLVEG